MIETETPLASAEIDEVAEVQAMLAARPSITRIYPFEAVEPAIATELLRAIVATKEALADSAEADRKLSTLLATDERISERRATLEGDQSIAARFERQKLGAEFSEIELPLEAAIEEGNRWRAALFAVVWRLWEAIEAATVPAAQARCVADFAAALAAFIPALERRETMARQSDLYSLTSRYWFPHRPAETQALAELRTGSAQLLLIAEEILAGTFQIKVVVVEALAHDARQMILADAMRARRERRRDEEQTARVDAAKAEAAAQAAEAEAREEAEQAASEREENQTAMAEAVA